MTYITRESKNELLQRNGKTLIEQSLPMGSGFLFGFAEKAERKIWKIHQHDWRTYAVEPLNLSGLLSKRQRNVLPSNVLHNKLKPLRLSVL